MIKTQPMAHKHQKPQKERILSLIASGKEQGATCLIDGSKLYSKRITSKVTGLAQHYLTDVTKEDRIYNKKEKS
eukprot:TRINITY_DN2181_c0_g1_i1.p2 TRINITY_DN2181_c0_g1~~TRINITY_DN2181_c0_g1_i1.p2  ORF type:complete len:74 (-),score=1.64 TRINITY_DN2181_c0_g1_i1:24-245(-)